MRPARWMVCRPELSHQALRGAPQDIHRLVAQGLLERFQVGGGLLAPPPLWRVSGYTSIAFEFTPKQGFELYKLVDKMWIT